ncbi:lipopolysaccharide-induced tumor necrosis factor-alpha factor homolog [Amyelois transitella]|uniref:lipopolysaccharide-induced tumor necrosis factor-alpha factor homolog n=1 Tax=Amyelois transitella TaxID=680683 RepID=UPI00067DDCA1|nr:lipopolysaccharide-induced tumor necrosis factor-alpha factor homolog [Amyelois transitella]XP_060810439.1 lipopolysaccharide-induced tumor necrosis factor-alpha factor homolog [Amyelois transitella]XP_060810440.1 lipopolysaccharide-induced tumor necrosis factor-alpha factor homolog [Amyelois transitella]XP_060810441.1 lipopolysaccharide-induced tumor necrosis factor-alpha factor homolog [Amyelois transitella]
MDNDNIPLYTETCPQPKIVTRHMDDNHSDGIILANQNQSPPPINVPVSLGPTNTVTICQYCHASVRTSVRHTVTNRTHMTAILCWICCCCCLPYCMNSTKNCDHYCPNCNKFLGTYEK